MFYKQIYALMDFYKYPQQVYAYMVRLQELNEDSIQNTHLSIAITYRLSGALMGEKEDFSFCSGRLHSLVKEKIYTNKQISCEIERRAGCSGRLWR